MGSVLVRRAVRPDRHHIGPVPSVPVPVDCPFDLVKPQSNTQVLEYPDSTFNFKVAMTHAMTHAPY
eukprot:SAG31_NODE_312_length_17856_cov_14.557827_12_plen_66_part_00